MLGLLFKLYKKHLCIILMRKTKLIQSLDMVLYSKVAKLFVKGDDQTISVQLRGGPESLMVSSWMQITQGRIKDSGTYSCLANNDHGTARATASVLVKLSQLPT